jgi:two-component system cell cycle response regulator DivK
VLVVDDVADNRDLYAEFLAFAKVDVDTAETAEEALAKLESERFDVVVMDLALPGMDGWEATKRIKSDPRYAGVTVLVLTGHVLREHVDRAQKAGADEVLTKPCLPVDLLAAIQKHVPLGGAAPTPTTSTRRRRAQRK